MSRVPRALLVLTLLAALPAAAGPSVVIYRCVTADGAVTLQNGSKCPKGTKEQKRLVATPATPAPAAIPVRVAAPAPIGPLPGARGNGRASTPGTAQAATRPAGESASASTVPVADSAALLPPPLIYACLTKDAQRYYSDAGESSRCAPLEAVGLDGQSPAPAEACEVVQDRCEPVPEAERCAAWSERRSAAEHALTFVPEQIDSAREEIARVDAAVAGTACRR